MKNLFILAGSKIPLFQDLKFEGHDEPRFKPIAENSVDAF